MKIEGNITSCVDFETIAIGETFFNDDNDICIRIQCDGTYTQRGSHYGLGVILSTGEVEFFDRCERVKKVSAKVVIEHL